MCDTTLATVLYAGEQCGQSEKKKLNCEKNILEERNKGTFLRKKSFLGISADQLAPVYWE